MPGDVKLPSVRTDLSSDANANRRSPAGCQALEIPSPRDLEDGVALAGRRVALRPVQPSDYPYLYQLSLTADDAMIVRWRYRGNTPSPESFAQQLWQGVLAQFFITKADRRTPLGIVSAYNANFRSGNVYIAIMVEPRYARQGWTLDAITLFLTYIFNTYGFRKAYYECLEFNYARLASGAGHHFHVEGCLREHEFHAGQYWHLYTLAVYREEYRALIAPGFRYVASTGKS